MRSDPSRAPAKLIVYAYQTDATGIYRAVEGATHRHGVLRGWAQTAADGRYRFETIRPASYPSRDTCAGVHMLILEPGLNEYWIDEVVFTDDALLTGDYRKKCEGRGGSGIVTPRKDASGRWLVTRDITLGKNIPNHPSGAVRR